MPALPYDCQLSLIAYGGEVPQPFAAAQHLSRPFLHSLTDVSPPRTLRTASAVVHAD